jgi:predicted ATPase/class 3 adenylate cyclase
MSDLLTGTVTFLFTDVEGSTRLLARLGERYRELQLGHDGIVREAIAEGNGVEVGTEGDSFFAVFATPNNAVRAAAEAQRKLAAEQWPDEVIVRVRMGLHTGEGTLGGANYLGLDVNRAARIASAAHGGQVLISDATRALIERSLPPSTRLRELGRFHLKDLPQPERLFQLVIEGLEQDFPPPRSLDARPHNLPAQLTRFIGRGEEIARTRELLARNRLVTLTGPGGTGKTRLGLEVAAESLADFRDGVFFVDLSATTIPEFVPATIAGALHLREQPGLPVLDTVVEHLRDRELLLVLDNFEQVVEGGAAILEPLLHGAHGLKALVTSRVPLHLYGEQEFPVPPLALPDPRHLPDLDDLTHFEAVTLFAERAAASRPDFRITPENARMVAEITARLDGLPLAIELAASRVKLLPPKALLARLQQRLPLLSVQNRNVPERQRTLRRTIDWSYDLLDDPKQRMFSRLAVFAGETDLEAVEAVVNPAGELGLDTLDGLASLVDNNLVRSLGFPDEEPRFGMLETIREYGLERLSQSGEESLIRRRHAEHWIKMAEHAVDELGEADQATWTRRLERDHSHFRSVLSWALQSGEEALGLRLAAVLPDFWRLGSHVREGRRWLYDLLALPPAAGNTLLRARALTAAAGLAGFVDATDEHLRFAEEAAAAYRDLGDPLEATEALEALGWARLQAGRLAAARASLLEAKRRNVDLGNRRKAGQCSMALGTVAVLEGHPDQARPLFEEALATFEDLHDTFWVAFTHLSVGHVDRLKGSDEAAEKRYRLSLSLFRQLDSPMGTTWALYAFADLALYRGEHGRALRLVGASDALRERVGKATPVEMALFGDVRAAARSYLDEATAEGLHQEGFAMAVEDAVTYAMQKGGA